MRKQIEDKMFLVAEITVISAALYLVVAREAVRYQKRRIRAAINRRFGNRFGST